MINDILWKKSDEWLTMDEARNFVTNHVRLELYDNIYNLYNGSMPFKDEKNGKKLKRDFVKFIMDNVEIYESYSEMNLYDVKWQETYRVIDESVATYSTYEILHLGLTEHYEYIYDIYESCVDIIKREIDENKYVDYNKETIDIIVNGVISVIMDTMYDEIYQSVAKELIDDFIDFFYSKDFITEKNESINDFYDIFDEGANIYDRILEANINFDNTFVISDYIVTDENKTNGKGEKIYKFDLHEFYHDFIEMVTEHMIEFEVAFLYERDFIPQCVEWQKVEKMRQQVKDDIRDLCVKMLKNEVKTNENEEK